jgi:hypothetical protein
MAFNFSEFWTLEKLNTRNKLRITIGSHHIVNSHSITTHHSPFTTHYSLLTHIPHHLPVMKQHQTYNFKPLTTDN